MIAIAKVSSTHNQVVISVAGFTAGFGAVDVQYSTRPDFRFVLSPLVLNVLPVGGNVTVDGLNQRTTYFFRMRERNGAAAGEWTNALPVYTTNNQAQLLTTLGANKAEAFVVAPERVVAWSTAAEFPGHPSSNLGTDSPNDQWWADQQGGAYAFEMQHGGAPVDTLAVLETNASAGCQVTVKAGNTLANVRGGAPAFSFGPNLFHASAGLGGLPGYHALVRLGGQQSYPFWRIEVTGAVPFSRFVATYACLGLARTAGKNMADDSQEVSIDLSSLERTREGNPDRKQGFRRGRKAELEIALMTEAAWESQFAPLRHLIGQQEPALVVPNSKPGSFLHERILYGPVSLRQTHPRSTRFSAALTVNSQI